MQFDEVFDSVVLLTWSNWATEPRSNRYHYATRFSKQLPTFFVQPNRSTPDILAETSGHDGLTIVSCGANYGREQEDALIDFLRENGCKKPLIWVYNPKFAGLLARLENSYFVFHATEDFTQKDSKLVFFTEEDRLATFSAIERCDLLVCVSDAVLENYRAATNRSKPCLVLRNGCDFDFWNDPVKSRVGPSLHKAPIAFYQGGINVRVDFDLLFELVTNMPDWHFWFAGIEDLRETVADRMVVWHKIKGLPNVTYHGAVDVDTLRELTFQASIGLIPFIVDPVIQASLPLKAYEYVAAGLGVVSVPIPAIQNEPAFESCTDAKDFEQAMRRLLPSRCNEEFLESRKMAAKAMDYDTRFKELLEVVTHNVSEMLDKPKKGLNVLFLYCDQFTHIKTIEENLKAFQLYSKHNCFFFASSDYPGWNMFSDFHECWPQSLDFSFYDVIVWHYGMPASLEEYFSLSAARQLARFDGLKVLFIQDEYENTATIGDWIKKAGIQHVMTCVPPEGIEYVYPRSRVGATEFTQTLTGFVPEPSEIATHRTPLHLRETRIGYRGRILPYHYGSLGWEKFQIGLNVREKALERGIAVDIEVDDMKRIYGEGWYKFLGSVRATLGTESGANVFDFDGDLKRKAAEARAAGVPYETFFKEHVEAREGFVRMNQVSPKFFEAIILKTALVCFEGTYSGVIEPHLHYIPLAKDFSNIEEVFEKLEDLDYLSELTERAYRDVIESGLYSYESFVASFDSLIESRTLRPPRTEIISAPIAIRRREEQAFSVLTHKNPMEFSLNTGILRQPFRRQEVVQAMEEVRKIEKDANAATEIAGEQSMVRPIMQ